MKLRRAERQENLRPIQCLLLKFIYCIWDEMERSCIRNKWRHVANETRKLQDREQGEDEGDAGQGIVTLVLVWSFLTRESKNKNSLFI